MHLTGESESASVVTRLLSCLDQSLASGDMAWRAGHLHAVTAARTCCRARKTSKACVLVLVQELGFAVAVHEELAPTACYAGTVHQKMGSAYVLVDFARRHSQAPALGELLSLCLIPDEASVSACAWACRQVCRGS